MYSQIRKQNDNLSTRNMELVKANTELRYKATDYENQVKEHKDKIRDQKKKLEYLHRSKKDLEENSEKVRVRQYFLIDDCSRFSLICWGFFIHGWGSLKSYEQL